MSLRVQVLRTLRTFHDSLTALGDYAAQTAEHLVQVRHRNHDHANHLQTLEGRTELMFRSMVTKGDIKEMHELLKELVTQGRAMQKHILQDHDEHGERLVAIEQRVGIR